MLSFLFNRTFLSRALIIVGVGLILVSHAQPWLMQLWYWNFQHSGVDYSVDTSLNQVGEPDKHKLITPVSTDFGLVIEKLDINEQVAASVDPSNPAIYLPKLQQFGVAQAKGSANPGQAGTTYLFGHSTVNIWDIAKYHAPFTLLNKLSVGDRIVTYFQGQRYDYKITQMKVVAPSEVHYLNDVSTQPTLILQTCDPPGSDTKRLLVMAALQTD